MNKGHIDAYLFISTTTQISNPLIKCLPGIVLIIMIYDNHECFIDVFATNKIDNLTCVDYHEIEFTALFV